MASKSIEVAHIVLFSSAVSWPFISPLAWHNWSKMRVKSEKMDQSQLIFEDSRDQHESSGPHKPIIREGLLQAIDKCNYGCPIALRSGNTAHKSGEVPIGTGPSIKG